jgi:hypothetical protein
MCYQHFPISFVTVLTLYRTYRLLAYNPLYVRTYYRFTCLIYCTPALDQSYIQPYCHATIYFSCYMLLTILYLPTVFLSSLLTYMYFLLIPRLSFVCTYCLTVMPISASASTSYLHFVYKPLSFSYVLTFYRYFYMYLSLYPFRILACTYCLTVMLLSSFSHCFLSTVLVC